MGFIIASSLLGSGALWALRLILAPGLFAFGSGATLGLDLLVVSAVAAAGMVISRGQWARNLGWFLVAVELVLAAVMEFDAWGLVTLVATVGSLILIAGPWLAAFLRQLPRADAPANSAILLALSLLLVPGIVAIANPAEMKPLHWLASAVGVGGTWAYSRAIPGGLWVARTLIPLSLLIAALFAPLAGGLLLVATAAGLLILAWSRGAAQAVHPLVRTTAGVAVPPELVPADLLAAAGYDERGRKREETK